MAENCFEKRRLVIAADGSGDFISLNDALDNANDGDCLFVKSGFYKEKFFIDKAVEISGDENNVPVFYIEDDNLCYVQANASISFIHFSNKNWENSSVSWAADSNSTSADSCDDDKKCLVKVTSSAVFRNCEFSYACGSLLECFFDDVKAEFYDCVFHDCPGDGIFIKEGCEAVFKNCRIFNFHNNGLLVIGASIDAENCEIYDCTDDGTLVNRGLLLKNAKGIVKGCRIHDIHGAGAAIYTDSNPLIENCEIYNIFSRKSIDGSPKDAIGFIFNDNCTGIYKNCRIHKISGIGVVSFSNANPAFENCEIYECFNSSDYTGYGIFLTGSSSGSYKNCKIHSLYGAGISVEDNSDPFIENCEIYDIFMKHAGSADNIDFIGFFCDKFAGLYIGKDARGKYVNCVVHDVDSDGIRLYSEKKPVIENFRIYNIKDKNILIGCRGFDFSDEKINESIVYSKDDGSILENDVVISS